MRLHRVIAFVVLIASLGMDCSAQSVTTSCTTTSPCIQVCTGGGSAMTCKFVPLSTIQIPGPPGATGPQGAAGVPGTAATVAVGTVTTLPAGASATVSNSGSTSAAVFNFGIPAGANGTDGINGHDGNSATIAVGTVTTLAPGQPVTVTDTGTPSAAIFNFGIPQGNVGLTGATGPAGPMIPGLSVSGKSLIWGDGTTGWAWVINSGGTMYICTPQPGAFPCAVQ